jgi:hypothetical protein
LATLKNSGMEKSRSGKWRFAALGIATEPRDLATLAEGGHESLPIAKHVII